MFMFCTIDPTKIISFSSIYCVELVCSVDLGHALETWVALEISEGNRKETPLYSVHVFICNIHFLSPAVYAVLKLFPVSFVGIVHF